MENEADDGTFFGAWFPSLTFHAKLLWLRLKDVPYELSAEFALSRIGSCQVSSSPKSKRSGFINRVIASLK
jgi:hypothetical protein